MLMGASSTSVAVSLEKLLVYVINCCGGTLGSASLQICEVLVNRFSKPTFRLERTWWERY